MKRTVLLSIAALALMFASCKPAAEKKTEEPAPVEEVAQDSLTMAADTTVAPE